MTAIRLAAVVRVSGKPAEIDDAYRREVQWPQGLRANQDVRLILLAAHRARSMPGARVLDDARSAVVLGSQYGSMTSYESFRASLRTGKPQPLAFSFALPSTPIAALSVQRRMKGPMVALSGGPEVGLDAVRRASLLLLAGRADSAIAGCWHAPSETATGARLPERCDAVLAILARDDTVGPCLPGGPGELAGTCCTGVLADWLVAAEARQ